LFNVNNLFLILIDININCNNATGTHLKRSSSGSMV
jgi:hypothetical protein